MNQPLSATERDTLAALVALTTDRFCVGDAMPSQVSYLTRVDTESEFENLCGLVLNLFATREKNPEAYAVYEDDPAYWVFSPTAKGRYEIFRG